MTSTDLVRASDVPMNSAILEYVNKGQIDLGVAEEDIERERERWEAGNRRDRNVAVAYEALENGAKLVDLHKVIQGGGGAKRPKLAVCPTWMKRVTCRTTRSGILSYRRSSHLPRWLMHYTLPHWHYDLPWNAGQSDERWWEASAFAPVMPPAVRRIATRDDLLLWEADWSKVTSARRMPDIHIDPALLGHVVGSLYEVKAAWDLTELEAAALQRG